MRWHDVLAQGVDHWSDFSDTDDERAHDDDTPATNARHVGGAPIASSAVSARGCDRVSDRSSGECAREMSAGLEGASAGEDGARTRPEGGSDAELAGRAGRAAGGDGDDGVSDGANVRPGSGWAKLGLGASWRGERRDLEWQCLWIELRMREISRHVTRYEARLRAIQDSSEGESAHKRGPSEENGRASNDGTRGDLIRTRRERVKGAATSTPAVLGHPMFAVLDDLSDRDGDSAKKRSSSGAKEPSTTTETELSGAKVAISVKRESTPTNNPKSSEEKKRKLMDGIAPKETNSDSDLSTTALYEQIDAAQKRVESLKQRLSKTAPKLAQKGAGGDKFKTPAAKNKGDRNGSDKTPVNSSGKRPPSRGIDAYDINNVVSAQGPAKYVERAIHETIATPKVRQASTYAPSFQIVTDGESSDEDVSDELYIFRHSKLEVEERSARAPLVRGRSGQKQAPTPTGKSVSLFDDDVMEELHKSFDVVATDDIQANA